MAKRSPKIITGTPNVNYKNIFESLEIITSWGKSRYVTIKKPDSPFHLMLASLEKADGEFQLLITEPSAYRFKLGDVKDVNFVASDYSFHTERVFINQISDGRISGKIGTLTTEGFKKESKSYFRLIVPLKKNFNFSLLHRTHRIQNKKEQFCELYSSQIQGYLI